MEAKKEVPIMEVESGDSSTEEAESESPRSVVVQMKKKVEKVHNQVLRIREEESHLGEDFFGGDDENNKNDSVYGGGVGAAGTTLKGLTLNLPKSIKGVFREGLANLALRETCSV
ncbi:hypothetical protein GOBAR_AA33779 [Gossypium barbadense]|uniref:Uncharacterized protein n=1 Tax=Gossypium barbadense TaxID=3634 RepID=A0A2P5W749_GOSBA|nr:hypothetical protein GOBAR_AA33779 [Gossypium barbadense]